MMMGRFLSVAFLYKAEEASAVMIQRGALQCMPGASPEFLYADVLDHFRTYSYIETFLKNPPRLNEQWTIQMDQATQKMCIAW
jgi:hypothetical protein